MSKEKGSESEKNFSFRLCERVYFTNSKLNKV